MSGAGGTNNSWTILTSEETVAETLRPFAAGAEQHDVNQKPAAGSGENNQPAQSAASAEGLPVEDYLVSEEKKAGRGADLSSDQHSSVPSSLEVSSTSDHGDKISPTETENQTQFSPDPESSSDSYTVLAPSPAEPPPGGAEFAGEELMKIETLHVQEEEELQQKGEESNHHPQTADTGKRAEVCDETTEKTGDKGDPEERRKKSLLAALEQIGRREEEEEEEEFHLPQQENDSIFSLNKCILGAVILLGIGTIFFSGVFMDLGEENDYATRELKDTETPGKQEWLNPDAPPHLDADGLELLNKLTEGNQQISALQAQLQAQKEELKVVKEQAVEGEKERLLWEEVEKENSRLKTEVASLPVLQKENDRMKKELESLPALQKELESLRSTVTKLKLPPAAGDTAQADRSVSLSPPTGLSEDSSQVTASPTERHVRKKDLKQEKHEMKKEKKLPKEREKSIRKEGEQKEVKDAGQKEWKKGKREEGMFDKEREKAGKQKRHSEETKEWKREKTVRGDDGKPWKDKKEGKEEWKRGKHEKVGEEWRGKEEKDRHGGKSRSERHKGREEWKGEMEWKNMKDGIDEGGRERWERKDWKERGEKKEWKKEKNGKDHNKEGRGKGERKQWEDGKSYSKERTGKDERKSRNEKQDEEWERKDEKVDQWKKEEWKRGGKKEKKHNGDWKKDQSHSSQSREHRSTADHREEHLYGEREPPHSRRRPSVGQPEYWVQQRDRLHLLRHPTPPQHCDSPESCAQAEQLLPVTLPDFQDVLQTYLTKAEEAGVDGSKTNELRKLADDFFKDGVFVHDQVSFQDFVEDLGDILEDLVEGENEDSDVEDEMEEFEKEAMKRFLVPGVKEKEKRMKGEWRKEGRQERG